MEVREVFRVDKTFPQEQGLLGQPKVVVGNGDGDFFVADEASMKIKVYDRNGRYAREFGGRGRGPGRFLSFFSIAMDGDVVVVADGYAGMFSSWSGDGEFIRAWPVRARRVWPLQFRRYDERQWLTLYLDSAGVDGNVDQLARPVLHLEREDFSGSLTEFGAIGELSSSSSDWGAFRFHAADPGRFVIGLRGVVTYVPGAYAGDVFQFSRSGRGWGHRRLRGFRPVEAPLKEVSGAEGAGHLRLYSVAMPGQGTANYAVTSQTLELFECPDGTIVHAFRLEQERPQVRIQAWSAQGEHLGSAEVRLLSEEAERGVAHRVLGHGSGGILFVHRFVEGLYSELRALRLE